MTESSKEIEKALEKEKMQKAYSVVYSTVKPLASLLYPFKVIGREHIPSGPAIICANHSSFIDPVVIAFAFGKENMIRFMAKKEVINTPIMGPVLKKCGVFPVDREKDDIEAIRIAMKCLKNGEKILIFPEGTRVNEIGAAEAKTGAVRIACKMHVPIIPVYVPRNKKVFGRISIIIGEPYYVEGASHDDYIRLADELMDKINAMQEQKS